jgi:hypothetical protein
MRRLAALIVVAIAVYLAVRIVEDRRLERRLASPVTDWPDVPVAPPEAVPPGAPPAGATG